jgi:hypothetical protein
LESPFIDELAWKKPKCLETEKEDAHVMTEEEDAHVVTEDAHVVTQKEDAHVVTEKEDAHVFFLWDLHLSSCCYRH